MAAKNKIVQYLSQFPGVAVIKNVFHYKYISDADFVRMYPNLDIAEGLTFKKVLVPKSINKDKLYSALRNEAVKFIVFPLTMHGELSKLCDSEHNCPAIINNQVRFQDYKGSNKGTHDIALMYNKQTQELEVIDYEFGLYNIFYNYEVFMNTDLITYTKPYFTKLGLTITKVQLPMIRENRFYHLKELLRTNRYPHDFSIIYKSYLANYLFIRTKPEYVDKPVAFFNSNRDVLTVISPKTHAEKQHMEDYIDRYLHLCRQMGEFPYDSKWIPLNLTQTKLFEFTKPCPKGYFRDFFTGECIKIPADLQISLPNEYLVKGKSVYPELPIKWIRFIIRYFKEQYPFVAMLEPTSAYTPHPYEYMIQFNDMDTYASKHPMSTRHAKTRMKMILPGGFDEFIDQAMSDTKIRFIMLLVGIKYEGAHASPVIIDKDTQTIERIEVNAPFIEQLGLTIQDNLDARLEKLFKSYMDFKDFEYIHPLSICPYGLHRAEFVERTENVSDIGGRCFEWTLYYLHLKLENQDVPTKVLASYAFEEMRKTGSIKHVVTGYTTGLIKKSTRKVNPVIENKRLSEIKIERSFDKVVKSKLSKKTV